jgi:hypothetical protein
VYRTDSYGSEAWPRPPRHADRRGQLGVNYRDAGRLNSAIRLLERAYREGQAQASLAWIGKELLDCRRIAEERPAQPGWDSRVTCSVFSGQRLAGHRGR